jgi:ABC-type amino acid transport substrate-binding protein
MRPHKFILGVGSPCSLLILILSIICSASRLLAHDKEIRSFILTEEEKEWIVASPKIAYTGDPDFPPIEWLDNDQIHRGLSADFIDLIEKKLGIPFRLVPIKTWSQAFDLTKGKKIDVLSSVSLTPQRLKYMRFTRPPSLIYLL